MTRSRRSVDRAAAASSSRSRSCRRSRSTSPSSSPALWTARARSSSSRSASSSQGSRCRYDLLFGFTGLLSFGHALYFAFGVYVTAIALTKWEWGLLADARVRRCWSLSRCLVVLGAVSLRVTGIAFAMVTLAFAQAGAVLVQKNPRRLDRRRGRARLELRAHPRTSSSGVLNTKNLYWLALGYAAVVFVVVRFAVGSSAGPCLAGGA